MDISPQQTFLLFSKYSTGCGKLLEIMNSSGVNFSFVQPICIDNQKIREKVVQDPRYNIRVVPTILCFYVGGNVETYEGENAFSWIQNMVKKYTPDIAPASQEYSQVTLPEEESQEERQEERQRRPDGRPMEVESQEPEEELIVKKRTVKGTEEMRRKIEQEREQYDQEIEQKSDDPRRRNTKVKTRPKPQKTSIEDLGEDPDEDPEEIIAERGDRFQNVAQPRRIRKGHAEYEESEDLYGGEEIPRAGPRGSVKNTAEKSIKPKGDIKSQAEAFESERKAIEKEFSNPSKRDNPQFRRP